MNQKQLIYFLTAYETRNLQKAADLLYVSRQGVSKMIRSLEKELGAPLFHRTPKGLEPTNLAQNLLPHVRNLLDEYQTILGMNNLHGKEKNVLIIFALDHILRYLGAGFLTDFHQAYPNIILSVVESTDDEAVHALLAQRANFSITTGPIDETYFTAVPLFFSRYCLQLPKDHPLAAKKAVEYTDLLGEKIITKGRAYRCFRSGIGTYMLLPGLAVDIFTETADEEVTLDLVEKGAAISISYDYIALTSQRPGIVLRSFAGEKQGQEIYLISLKDTALSPAERSFQKFLTAWLAEHPKEGV